VEPVSNRSFTIPNNFTELYRWAHSAAVRAVLLPSIVTLMEEHLLWFRGPNPKFFVGLHEKESGFKLP